MTLLIYGYIEPVKISDIPYYQQQLDGTYKKYYSVIPTGPKQQFVYNSLDISQSKIYNSIEKSIINMFKKMNNTITIMFYFRDLALI